MNITPKSFILTGIESDIQGFRGEINRLQKSLNELSSLAKNLKACTQTELAQYLNDSKLEEVFEQVKKIAADMTRNEYIQFVQNGGLLSILEEHRGKHNQNESDNRGDSSVVSSHEQLVNGSQVTKEEASN